MKLRFLPFLATVLAVLLSSGHAWAEKRIALVIGNGTYPKVGNLGNPPNDARLMANTLRQIGFDVIERIDADQKAMKKAIKAFGEKLQDAGKDSVGLFYYAGHGVQVGGANYLIPVNVDIDDEADVDIEAVSANVVQAQMAFAGSRLNIIIMDACRNNPFKRSFRAASRGLARMDATKGTLIAYATGPGDVAADGRGANSPYTEALANALLTPGLTVERMFKQVRNDVVAATNSKQVPWESSSLTGGDFYFTGGSATATAPVQPKQQQAAPVDREAMFWDTIRTSEWARDFEEYLKQFPEGTFSGLAHSRIEALKEQQVAVVTQPKPSPPPSQAKPAVGVFNGPVKVFRDCDICPEMVVVPAGSFRMGDLSGDGKSREKPVHTVTIRRPFAIGKYEVTQGEWTSTLGTNPALHKGDRNPVEQVSWNLVHKFLRQLSIRTGERYRLPSEAEWEYVARAGTTTKYYWGDSLGSGNVGCDGCPNNQDAPVSVGIFPANAFGVHDMLGNVTEWVSDCYNEGYEGAPKDGSAWMAGECIDHVMRGGASAWGAEYLRVSSRGYQGPDHWGGHKGFRVVRDLK